MRQFIFFICILMAAVTLHGREHFRHMPRTEVQQVNAIINCLQAKDTARYFSLFPPFDTLWHMVMHNPDQSPEVQKEMAILKEHPQSLVEFDPLYNRDIIGRFCGVLAKGEDSGIIWSSVVLQRYELQKDFLTRNLQGYDRIAPERFKGFVFLKDLLTRRTFCVTVTEIQKIKGYYFGGQVINILEASSIDDFLAKEDRERKYFQWLADHPLATDSTGSATDSTESKTKDLLSITRDEDDETKKRKEVVERRYYEGTFDKEIPVKLYVRYMKDVGGKILSYDGLYKFGDGKKYIKLEIKIDENGNWLMEDEVPLGIMELQLKGQTYAGTWTNNDENGYDVELRYAPIPQTKVEALDKILDQGGSGRIDEESFQQPEKKEEKKKKKEKAEDSGKDRGAKEDKKKKHDREKQKDDDEDDEWKREQQRAKQKERKKLKKLYHPREED